MSLLQTSVRQIKQKNKACVWGTDLHKETCPKGCSNTKIVSSWIPSCPASRHSPLQPLGTPTNGRWQLHSSSSFPSSSTGSTGKRGAKAAVTVDEHCHFLGSHNGKFTLCVAMSFLGSLSASKHAQFASLPVLPGSQVSGFYPFSRT